MVSACIFVPANEPWECRVHRGVRTSLDEPQCDIARPAEPFNDAYLDNIRQGIAEGRNPGSRYNVRRLLATIDARSALLDAARSVDRLWDEPDADSSDEADDLIWMTMDEAVMRDALRALRLALLEDAAPRQPEPEAPFDPLEELRSLFATGMVGHATNPRCRELMPTDGRCSCGLRELERRLSAAPDTTTGTTER